LAQSIRELGLINPLTVRRKGRRYEIVAGVRRYLAVKSLDWPEVPCVVLPAKGSKPRAITIHENLVREDVKPMDMARYLAQYRSTSGKTLEQIARELKRSPAWVSVMLSLNELPDDTQALLESGQVDYMTAREIGQVEDDVKRRQIIEWTVRSGANRATVRGWVARAKAEKEGTGALEGPMPRREEAEAPPAPIFRCKVCEEFKPQTDMLLVRVDSECYTLLEKSLEVMRELQHGGLEDSGYEDTGPGEGGGEA